MGATVGVAAVPMGALLSVSETPRVQGQMEPWSVFSAYWLR